MWSEVATVFVNITSQARFLNEAFNMRCHLCVEGKGKREKRDSAVFCVVGCPSPPLSLLPPLPVRESARRGLGGHTAENVVLHGMVENCLHPRKTRFPSQHSPNDH